MSNLGPIGCGNGRASRSALGIHNGMNLREARAIARRLGASVEEPRRTGEIRLRHPLMPKPVLANGRRKDAPRAMTGWLRQLEQLLAARPPAPASRAA
jgi:hypothetical protein